MLLLIKLLSAHFVADFALQSKSFCDRKKNLKSVGGWCAQLLHALVHAVAAYLFVAQWNCWLLPLVIFFSHLAIDVCKSCVNNNSMTIFAADQIAHLLILAFVYSCLLGGAWVAPDLNCDKIWVIVLAYLLSLSPAAIFINIFNERFGEKTDGKSLPSGGKTIGYLERILIVTFIFSGWIEGVGYLLAAKSVFRFGDLKNNNELKRTEYVLVGTFLSFAIAVIVGVVAKYVILPTL